VKRGAFLDSARGKYSGVWLIVSGSPARGQRFPIPPETVLVSDRLGA
jgi:hypothetical protein